MMEIFDEIFGSPDSYPFDVELLWAEIIKWKSHEPLSLSKVLTPYFGTNLFLSWDLRPPLCLVADEPWPSRLLGVNLFGETVVRFNFTFLICESVTIGPPFEGTFSLFDSFKTLVTFFKVTVLKSSFVICGFSAFSFFCKKWKHENQKLGLDNETLNTANTMNVF